MRYDGLSLAHGAKLVDTGSVCAFTPNTSNYTKIKAVKHDEHMIGKESRNMIGDKRRLEKSPIFTNAGCEV